MLGLIITVINLLITVINLLITVISIHLGLGLQMAKNLKSSYQNLNIYIKYLYLFVFTARYC